MNADECAIVEMPEGGVYVMRIETDAEGAALAGREAVVLLDYGIDAGRVTGTVPKREGETPGFAVLRPFGEADAAARQANARDAKAIGEELAAAAEGRIPGFRLYSARFSLGRRKLFVRFSAAPARVPADRLMRALGRRCDFMLDARQLGPREQAAEIGCLGECGRVCCRAAMKRLPCAPRRMTPGARPPARACGTCGCVKCCLDWENDSPEDARK